MPSILDIAQLAVKAAMQSGAEWADAVVMSGRSVAVMVENSSIRECEVVRQQGIGVRAFHRGGAGSSTSTALDEDAARQVGEQAAAMAKATHGDPDFVSLPDPQPFEEIPELWDDAAAGVPADRVVEWCRRGIEEARSVADEVAVSGGADLSTGEKAIASSTGVGVHIRGTHVGISFVSVVRRGDDVGAYFEYDTARRMADFEPAGVGEKATDGAMRFLGARQIAGGRMPLVLGPMATCGLISGTIGAASAESVQRKRSFMIGKEGERIAAPCLTVREAPLVPAGIASAAVDGEGVPKVARTLIDRGVLATYLHNSYTANKANVENTANASRSGYSAGVGIGVANIQADLGTKTQAELIAEIDEGLYIDYGGLEPDSATGDISATVDFGFKIEKGELAYPVSTTMIGTDVLEILGNVDAVSSDYREEPGVIAPSLRTQGIMVVGGE